MPMFSSKPQPNHRLYIKKYFRAHDARPAASKNLFELTEFSRQLMKDGLSPSSIPPPRKPKVAPPLSRQAGPMSQSELLKNTPQKPESPRQRAPGSLSPDRDAGIFFNPSVNFKNREDTKPIAAISKVACSTPASMQAGSLIVRISRQLSFTPFRPLRFRVFAAYSYLLKLMSKTDWQSIR